MRLPFAPAVLCALLAQPAFAARPEITIDPGGLPASALQAVTHAVDSMADMADDQDGDVERLGVDVDELRARTVAERAAAPERLRTLVAGYLALLSRASPDS